MAINKKTQDLTFIEASGFSMWPFLRAEDKLVVKKTTLEDIKIGDIILYIKDSQLVCHRLIKKIKEKDGYLLYVRGDNSRSTELIAEDVIKGRVIGLLRKNRIRNLVTKYQQFIGRIIAVFNPFIRGGLKIVKFLKRGGGSNE